MRRATLLAILVAAAAAWWLWASDERRIRAHLDEMSQAASAPAGESDLARVSRLGTLRAGLTEDASIDPGDGRQPLEGRDAVLGLAIQAARTLAPLEVMLADVDVSVEGVTARATATAIVRRAGSEDARAVTIDLRDEDGWKVARVIDADALRRPR